MLIPALVIYAGLRGAEYQGIVWPGNPLGFSFISACERQYSLILNLNLPGSLIGAPFSIPQASFLRQHPSAFSMKTWHTITLPFFCLPAWWLVGRGLDALVAKKRLHWAMLAIGAVFSCGAFALSIGILISPPADRSDLMGLLPGSILWAVAFSVLPLSWIVARRAQPK